MLPPKLQLAKKLMPSLSFKFDPLLQTENRAGRTAKRGTTGNYYCRAELGEARCGCDGHCGPNNGCCCVDCMRLTLESQGIREKNVLVNSDARLVKIEDRQVKGCYVMMYSDRRCQAPDLCSECSHLAVVVLRYSVLLE